MSTIVTHAKKEATNETRDGVVRRRGGDLTGVRRRSESRGTWVSPAKKQSNPEFAARVTHGAVTSTAGIGPTTRWIIGGTQGFKFTGLSEASPQIVDVIPIVPGSTLSLDFFVAPPLGEGVFRYKGGEYVIPSPLLSASTVRFSTPSFDIPQEMQPSLHFAVPFTMSGFLGYECDCTPLESFRAELTGSGTAEVDLERAPDIDEYRVVEVKYTFTGQ